MILYIILICPRTHVAESGTLARLGLKLSWEKVDEAARVLVVDGANGRFLMGDDHGEIYGGFRTPKSSILVGLPLKKHPFWGTPILGNPHIRINCF